jgi:predicted AAA+ superfamily ATPase
LARELYPFSYGEYRRFTGLGAGVGSLGAYLETGGFPEYLKSGSVEALAQLQTDILYRDIAARYGIRDVASLRRLYVYLASNPARKVSPSRLPRVVGVRSPATVLEYVAYLEAAYLVRLLPCFAWSAKARSLSPKKVYLVDPGVVKSGSVAGGGGVGAALENAVYNELRARGEEAYYFAGPGGGECDFVTGSGGGACRCAGILRGRRRAVR